MPAPHLESHRDLLQRFQPGRQRRIDAILVAAGRSAEHLAPAAALADRLGCLLVALCSPTGARPEEIARKSANWRGTRGHTVDLPLGYDHPLMRLHVTQGFEQTVGRLGLLSVKRNVGLLLGRLLGWRAVLFLDDDIVRLDPLAIADAATGLDHSAAVGLAVRKFADNSVVCHANRLGEGPQDIFVSGSALLVDCNRPFEFFPNIYNEDWIFLFDALAQRRVTRTKPVQQIKYDPYADPSRARDEEFGEVIAEGLVDGLHHEVAPSDFLRSEYWDAFLESRAAFIARAEQRVRDNAPDDRRADALASLAAAEMRRQKIDPDYCAAWVDTWRADVVTWHRRIEDLPRLWSVEEAARFLELATSPIGPRSYRRSLGLTLPA